MFFFHALAFWLAAFPARAEIIEIPCSADTSLHELFPNNNMGATLHLSVGATAKTVPGGNGQTHPSRLRALLRFDLEGKIPADAVINAVRLKVKVLFTPTSTPLDARHRLVAMNVNWGEGRGPGPSGDTALPGEVSWSHQSAPDLWPAGYLEELVTSPSSAEQTIGGEGEYTFESTAALIDNVQRWLADTSRNFGWMLLSDAETALQSARRFGSREVEGNGAILEIDFSRTPAEPLKFEAIQLVDGNVRISWSGGTPMYLLETAADLASSEWSPVGSLTDATGVELPRSTGPAFFRLRDHVAQ